MCGDVSRLNLSSRSPVVVAVVVVVLVDVGFTFVSSLVS